MTVRQLARHTGCIGITLVLAITGVASADTTTTYRYSDEWALVSAPPPSGPYRSVHIDPRVPGQGIAPPLVSGVTTSTPEEAAVHDGAMTATAEDQQPMPAIEASVEPPAVSAEQNDPASPMPDAARAAAVPEIEVPPPPAAGMPAATDIDAPRPAQAIDPVQQADSTYGNPGVSSDMPSPVPGYYGRMMPPPPRYEYPGSAWQGMPGYRSMPPMGYYPVPRMPPGGDYPPPAYRPGGPYNAR